MEKTPEYQALERAATHLSNFDDAYLIARFDDPARLRDMGDDIGLKRPSGLSFILIEKGAMTLEINCEDYHLGQGDVITLGMDFTGCIKDVEQGELRIWAILASEKFVRTVNLNLSSLSHPAFKHRPSPVMHLEAREVPTILSFINILAHNAETTPVARLSANMASSLFAALIYQMMAFIYSHIEEKEDAGEIARRHNYVHQFMRLLHLHYTRERSVAFYASQLCVTPKYLSLLVKEATGKTATAWIDNFLVMEAKNMLRYSGRNVQQVAYALNFQNQSAFGKFFRLRTGMSPSEYQKNS